jgi:hypothetical protein
MNVIEYITQAFFTIIYDLPSYYATVLGLLVYSCLKTQTNTTIKKRAFARPSSYSHKTPKYGIVCL